MRALIELKKECFERVGLPECFCCENQNTKQLVLHHLSYDKDSVTYNRFENSSDGRLKYYVMLLDEIKNKPDNFLVLCMDCHQVIERLLKMKWIDAYNFCNDNNCNNYQYYDAWNLSYEKRVNNTYQPKYDEIICVPTDIEEFFK